MAPSPSPSSAASPAPSRRAVVGAAAGLAGVAVAGGLTGPAAALTPSRRTPDLVLLNGDVLPMGRGRWARPVEAVAIRGGVVTDVGTTREIRRQAGRRTQVVDLEGRTALPGINDAHVHGLAAGVSLPPISLDVSYPTATSIAQITQLVAAAAQAAAPGDWIRGNGWNTALLDETRADPTRLPTAADLDAVAPNNPVALRDFSFHTVWANTAAMTAAGITAGTPDPAGGVIDRDASGRPIGLFRENAQPLILAAIPALSVEDQRAGLQRAFDILLSQGITSYTDPGLTADELAVYLDALDQGEINVRVSLMLTSSRSLAIGGTGNGSVELLDDLLEQYPHPQVFARHLLALRGVKIFADGIPPNRTAWVYDPYLDVPGYGDLVVEGDTDEDRVRQIAAIVRRAHRAGFQVGTHATGDRTIDVVTDAYLAAMRGDRRHRDPRHYTIHSDLATDRALRRLGGAGLGANMNPSIKELIADSMVPVLGAERAARQWPTLSALRAGATLTSASDWPVTSPDWRSGIVSGVLRRDIVSGNVSGPEERLSVAQALHTYTTAGAYQDGAEDWKGRLLPGLAADVCVLDGRLPRRPEEIEALLEIPVAMTVFAGDVVYERSPSSAGGAAGAGATAAVRRTGSRCAHADLTCCCNRAPELLAGLP